SGVAFIEGDVVDRDGRNGVVVVDRADAGDAGKSRAGGVAAQTYGERLVRLELRVAVDRDAERLRRHTRREVQRLRLGHVVVVDRRGRAVSRCVIDGNGRRARIGECDVEGEGRRTGVALAERDVIDRDLRQRVVVVDRTEALVVEDRGTDRRRQIDEERL